MTLLHHAAIYLNFLSLVLQISLLFYAMEPQTIFGVQFFSKQFLPFLPCHPSIFQNGFAVVVMWLPISWYMSKEKGLSWGCRRGFWNLPFPPPSISDLFLSVPLSLPWDQFICDSKKKTANFIVWKSGLLMV